MIIHFESKEAITIHLGPNFRGKKVVFTSELNDATT